MILTGSAIEKALESGDITISPYEKSLLRPNSYRYRLGPTLKGFTGLDAQGNQQFESIPIPPEGYVLEPGIMYLGNTLETIGSSKYAMSLIGKNSMGRRGLFLQVAANLLHTTSCHQVTLELVATLPLRLYAGMVIGQVSFWDNLGQLAVVPSAYSSINEPHESLIKVG